MTDKREFTDFEIEFYSEATEPGPTEIKLYNEAENTLRKLAKGNTDITGATVHIAKPANGKGTDFIYEATVVLYSRPENIAATESSDNLMGALKGALKAAERQLRQKRERLREREQRGR